mgnify:CR=1 FL=1
MKYDSNRNLCVILSKTDGTLVDPPTSWLVNLLVGTNSIDNVVQLVGHITGNPSQACWTSLREVGSTSDYVVPTGKTLCIVKILYAQSSGDVELNIGYADAGAGMDSTTEPTNAVYFTRYNDPSGLQTATPFWGHTANETYQHDVLFKVPEGKYPFIYGGYGPDVYFICWGVLV